MNEDKTIYSLSISDLQTVSADELGRELSNEEIETIIGSLGDYIPWYDLLSNVIKEKIVQEV